MQKRQQIETGELFRIVSVFINFFTVSPPLFYLNGANIILYFYFPTTLSKKISSPLIFNFPPNLHTYILFTVFGQKRVFLQYDSN